MHIDIYIYIYLFYNFFLKVLCSLRHELNMRQVHWCKSSRMCLVKRIFWKFPFRKLRLHKNKFAEFCLGIVSNYRGFYEFDDSAQNLSNKYLFKIIEIYFFCTDKQYVAIDLLFYIYKTKLNIILYVCMSISLYILSELSASLRWGHRRVSDLCIDLLHTADTEVYSIYCWPTCKPTLSSNFELNARWVL